MHKRHSHQAGRLLPLPASCQGVYGVYWRPTPEFIDELSDALCGMRVLEIFAGNGYLAGLMAARGIDIVATSVPSSIDAHERGDRFFESFVPTRHLSSYRGNMLERACIGEMRTL